MNIRLRCRLPWSQGRHTHSPPPGGRTKVCLCCDRDGLPSQAGRNPSSGKTGSDLGMSTRIIQVRPSRDPRWQKQGGYEVFEADGVCPVCCDETRTEYILASKKYTRSKAFEKNEVEGWPKKKANKWQPRGDQRGKPWPFQALVPGSSS